MRRDPQVVISDRTALFFQLGADFAVHVRRTSVETLHRNVLNQCLQLLKSVRAAAALARPEPELTISNGGHDHVARPQPLEPGLYLRWLLPGDVYADVRVQH